MPRRNKHVPAYQLVLGDEIPTYGEHGGPYRRVSQIDQDGPTLTVIYDDGDSHKFAWNNTIVVKDSNLADWERELLSPADRRKVPPLFYSEGIPFMHGPPGTPKSMLAEFLRNAPGGNHMTRSTRDVDSRLSQLANLAVTTEREIRFLESLPAEPDVDIDSVEPTVLLFNKLHPDTGKVVKSTVVRSSTSRNGEVVGWTASDEGYAQDWVTAVRQAFDCNSDFEIRQLNPGTVVYTTVPSTPAKTTRKRTTT